MSTSSRCGGDGPRASRSYVRGSGDVYGMTNTCPGEIWLGSAIVPLLRR